MLDGTSASTEYDDDRAKFKTIATTIISTSITSTPTTTTMLMVTETHTSTFTTTTTTTMTATIETKTAITSQDSVVVGMSFACVALLLLITSMTVMCYFF